MKTTYDRRFFAPLAFLFFLVFLGFLGTEYYRHLAVWAAPASLASLAGLVFVPRNAANVPPEYRLSSHREIFQALVRKAGASPVVNANQESVAAFDLFGSKQTTAGQP